MTTVTGKPDDETDASTRYERHRGLLLWMAASRFVVFMIAVPLAPFLYREHIAVLVLLRPTKEVLLLAGFVLERGDASLPAVLAAALPLLLGGVWLFFALGRAFADDIDGGDRSALVRRLLPGDRIEQLRGAIEDQGTRLVLLGRLAAFPSTLVAAAAGAGELSTRRFVVADAAGALVSTGMLLACGYLAGEAYDEVGPWITAAGTAVLGTGVYVLGRALKQAGPRR